jgi:nucleoid-associated protein YgaU
MTRQFAKLRETDGGAEVKFQFNPATIQVSHGCSFSELGGGSDKKAKGKDGEGSNLTTQQLLDKAGKTTVKLSNIWFDGHRVVDDCGQLLRWTYAYESPKDHKAELTPLTFSWGMFSFGGGTTAQIPVTLSNVSVTYNRFSSRGLPVRATVAIDMLPNSSTPLAQNPTSGGLPNRRAHVMVAGETLAGIAVATYGSPGDWRALAEVNAIDDPLRTRPGASLYLPERGELHPTARA